MIKDDTSNVPMTQCNLESSHLTDVMNAGIDDYMRQELETIRRKKADAERELKEMDSRRTELEQWLRDLAVTERTLARVLDVDLPEVTNDTSHSTRRKKPENIPTIYDMAVTILRERGDEFLEGQDIVAGIRSRWWPDVTNNDVTPTLWRLATKDKRLRKDGTKYGLPIRAAIRVPLSEAS